MLLLIPGVLAGCGTDDPPVFEPPARACDLDAPFLEPKPVAELNTAAPEGGARLSPDQLTVYFHRRESTLFELFVATRASVDDPFGPAVPIRELAGTGDAFSPSVTADGLTIYFDRNNKIWQATRSSPSSPFGQPTMLDFDVVWDDYLQRSPYVTSNAILFMDVSPNAAGSDHVARALRVADGSFTSGRWLDEDFRGGGPGLSGARAPIESDDGLRMFFHGDPFGPGGIMTSTRSALGGPLQGVAPVDELNTTAGWEEPTWLSPDGCVLYFVRDDNPDDLFRHGDLWRAERPAP